MTGPEYRAMASPDDHQRTAAANVTEDQSQAGGPAAADDRDGSSDRDSRSAVDGGTIDRATGRRSSGTFFGRIPAAGERFRRLRPREQLEVAGLAVTAVLGLFVLGFLAADWARTLSVAPTIAAYAEAVFEEYLVLGEWLDYYLGTSVFWIASTWRAIATGVLVGIVTPLVGVFLVHRQMALIGETLAHTAFAGVAIGVVVTALLGWSGSLLYVAFVVSALGALGLQWLIDRTNSYGDVPIAIVLSGSFALGTVLISWSRDFAPVAVDIEGYLFGSLAIVTAEGARAVAVITAIVVVVVLATYRPLLYITFDERAARVSRLPVDRYNVLLIVMTAVVVVGAMQILGVILVAAMLVVPAATASQLAHGFRETVRLSILAGQFAVLVGLGFSLAWGLPPGGSIVLVGIGLYVVSVLASDRSPGELAIH